jgi:hypothetical protein
MRKACAQKHMYTAFIAMMVVVCTPMCTFDGRVRPSPIDDICPIYEILSAAEHCDTSRSERFASRIVNAWLAEVIR